MESIWCRGKFSSLIAWGMYIIVWSMHSSWACAPPSFDYFCLHNVTSSSSSFSLHTPLYVVETWDFELGINPYKNLPINQINTFLARRELWWFFIYFIKILKLLWLLFERLFKLNSYIFSNGYDEFFNAKLCRKENIC